MDRKKTFKEKAKEAMEKTKQFYNNHKTEILGIAAVLLSVVAYFAMQEGDDSDDKYSHKKLSKLSYDELNEARNYVQANPQEFGESREFVLGSIDSVLRNIANPRREYAKLCLMMNCKKS